jgi:two-component system chemotaxis response regulator CheB
VNPEGVVRVLVVDDSRTVRAVLTRVLSGDSGLAVVAEAVSGEEAVAAVHHHRPDVVLMDVEMPGMDGLEASSRIAAERPTPIVLFTTHADSRQLQAAFAALQRGVVDILPKPRDPEGWQALSVTLPGVLRQVVDRKPRGDSPVPVHPTPQPSPFMATPDLVAVGASTGGPAALREFLGALPADGPVAVVVVQHIAPGFETGLADWLDGALPWDVRVAREGETLRPGRTRLAPAGSHLVVAGNHTLHLDSQHPSGSSGHRPSADVLLESCARSTPGRTVGVLLSGMGADGAAGLLALRLAGGFTLVQSEASCAVFGMPRAAMACGAADLALPPAALGAAIAELWSRRHR